eukprot:764647-Hanusia_phi.AAC.2
MLLISKAVLLSLSMCGVGCFLRGVAADVNMVYFAAFVLGSPFLPSSLLPSSLLPPSFPPSLPPHSSLPAFCPLPPPTPSPNNHLPLLPAPCSLLPAPCSLLCSLLRSLSSFHPPSILLLYLAFHTLPLPGNVPPFPSLG